MAIPEQIRKQTEAVQQLYAQLNADDSAGGATPPADGVTAESSVDNPAPADGNTDTNEAATPPADEQKAGGDNVSDDTVVQKYKTLQGMYNAEVPRLHQQNRELNQRVQQMEQLLASLSAQKEPAAAPQPVEKLVTEHDVAEYGESIDVMRRVSMEEVNPLVQRIAKLEQLLTQMQTNVVPQVQAVAQRQQLSAEQQFWTDLTGLVPNFRDINANGDFQTWLLEADPLTGITRQTYLDDAQRALDARRVSNFFRTWLDTTGQAVDAQPTGRATNPELEKQVAPGRSRGSGTPAAANKAKVYSPQDIQKFFDEVRSGKYKGREADRDRIERDIFAAQRENRIVANS
jgi:cell division septum initiation protein DivIVA